MTGVAAGDRVVIEGSEGLRAGDKVTVTPRHAGTPGKPEAP
jgi:hypothetical protein